MPKVLAQQLAVGVGQLGPELHGAGLLVHLRALPDQLARDFLIAAVGPEVHRLARLAASWDRGSADTSRPRCAR